MEISPLCWLCSLLFTLSCICHRHNGQIPASVCSWCPLAIGALANMSKRACIASIGVLYSFMRIYK